MIAILTKIIIIIIQSQLNSTSRLSNDNELMGLSPINEVTTNLSGIQHWQTRIVGVLDAQPSAHMRHNAHESHYYIHEIRLHLDKASCIQIRFN